MMDLDELQSVQSRERQTDSLQQLRESFYRDAGEFIEQLRRERDRAAERADDPWNSPEVNRLNDDIDTAEGTVEAIYERRVGKIVKMASLAAADMPTEDEGLTAEERSLFETLVEAIENNRIQVESILDGDAPIESPVDSDGDAGVDATDGTGPKSTETADSTQLDRAPADTAQADPTTGREPVEADEPTKRSQDRQSEPPAPPSEEGSPAPPSEGGSPPESAGDDDRREQRDSVDAASLMGSDGDAETGGNTERAAQDPEPTGAPESADDAGVDRTTVKITSDVGEIFGVDDREYELSAEDVVTLPTVNAEPLVESDAATRLD